MDSRRSLEVFQQTIDDLQQGVDVFGNVIRTFLG